LSRWSEPLPEHPTDPHEMLRLLDEVGSPATMAMAGPRFFGFVIGSALPATVAANWIASAWDQNTGLDEATPSPSRPPPAPPPLGLAARAGRARLAAGRAAAPGRDERGVRDRRDDGELHLPGRGAPRGAGAGRLGRRGERADRRAPGRGDRWRRGASHAHQVA